jgi:hypothetical protein
MFAYIEKLLLYLITARKITGAHQFVMGTFRIPARVGKLEYPAVVGRRVTTFRTFGLINDDREKREGEYGMARGRANRG